MGRILFCDLDGSLVHYPKVLNKWGKIEPNPDKDGLYSYLDLEGNEHKLVQLPTSKSLKQGYISVGTLEKLAEVRAAGIPLVLVSGSRTSTILQRIPFLPVADVYVTENGGRVFFRNPAVKTGLFLREDLDWRSKHNDVAGPLQQELEAPQSRIGSLWELVRHLKCEGWAVDCEGYSVCARVTGHNQGKALTDIPEVVSIYTDIQSTLNLGAADVYPRTSGKESAGQYLIELFKADPSQCLFICDDDNDMELANTLGHVFVPSITAESVTRSAEADPSRFTIIRGTGGTMATELALDNVLEVCNQGM